MMAMRMVRAQHRLVTAPRLFLSRIVLCFGIGIGLLVVSSANADSIFVGTLERKNVTIKELKGDSLIFDFNGRTTEQQASKITRVVVTAEPVLTAAEEAYATSKWDDAVDNYQKAQRSAKPWVKDWASLRLIDAASKSGRFDAAAAAYVAVLLKDPATAASAKPAMPDSKSTFLDSAASDVNTALKDPKLTADQRKSLLGFLVEIQQTRKDQVAEDAAYAQLTKLPGADSDEAGAKRILGRRKLSSAQKALEAKNYALVASEIESGKPSFVDLAMQSDALYLLAEAQMAQAGSDGVKLKDTALAYMRVVALAKNEPSKPHVVDSLVKTALILDRLGDPPAAGRLYEQIITQYPDDPLAAVARQNLAKLKQN